MAAALRLTFSILSLLTMSLHILGSYLLIYQYRNGVQNPQQLFLINLAATESIINFLKCLSSILYMASPTALYIQQCQPYVRTLRGYGFNSVYYLTMIYLTFDKLFDIILNIKYPLYWNEKRTSNLLKVTWTITITTAITISIIYHYTGYDFLGILDMYVYPIFDFVFIIVAILTYGFIFHQYKETRMPPTQNTSNIASPSAFQVFVKSRFYIPVLLISTFVVFMAIPEMIHLSFVYMERKPGVTMKTTLKIFWSFSYLGDAIIYIWMKPSVKKLLMRKLGINPRKFKTSIRLNRVGVSGSNVVMIST